MNGIQIFFAATTILEATGAALVLLCRLRVPTAEAAGFAMILGALTGTLDIPASWPARVISMVSFGLTALLALVQADELRTRVKEEKR